jgi:hypothetical protein
MKDSPQLDTDQIAEQANEFSWFEKYLIYSFSKWFADRTTPLLKSVFKPKKKTFWDRVKEQM